MGNPEALNIVKVIKITRDSCKAISVDVCKSAINKPKEDLCPLILESQGDWEILNRNRK